MPHRFSTSMAGMSSSSAEFGGDAPTLSPAASRRPAPGQVGELLVEHGGELCRAAHRHGLAVDRGRRRAELAVEVVQTDDRDRLDAVRALHDVQQDLALAVLRLGDAEEVRERRGEVDRAGDDLALGDPLAAGQERRAHVDVVLRGPGHPGRSRAGRRSARTTRACRASRRRTGRAGRRRSTTSPVRVGWAMSAVVPGPFGIARASAREKTRSIIFQPSALPSRVQSFGSVSARYLALIAATVAATCGGRDLGRAGSPTFR